MFLSKGNIIDAYVFIVGIKDASRVRFNICIMEEIMFLFQTKWCEKRSVMVTLPNVRFFAEGYDGLHPMDKVFVIIKINATLV